MDINAEIIFLLLILFIGFLLRNPYRYLPIDEDYGFYTYVAHFRNKGVRFIKDFWGSIFPLLFYFKILIYQICRGDVKRVRLFFTAYNSLTAVSIFCLVSHMHSSAAGLLSALLYSVFSSSPNIGSYSINGEKYYLLPITLSAYFLLTGMEKEPNLIIISGIFMGIAFLIKPVVIVSAAVFSFYILIYSGLPQTAFYAAGFSSVVMLHFLIIFYTFKKDIKQLMAQNKQRLVACFNIIGSYLETLDRLVTDIIPLLKETLFLWVAAVPYILIACVGRTSSQIFVLFWIGAVFLTIAGQKSFWQYQYQPVIHIFSIASAIFLIDYYKGGTAEPAINIPFSVLLALSLIYSLKNLLYYPLNRANKVKYFNRSRKMEQYLYLPELAGYINRNSTEEDYIYVWGAYTNLYIMSDRQSCEKSVFHFIRPYRKELEYQYDETIKGIIEKKPKFIIQIFSSFNIEYLNKLTGLYYVVDRVFYNMYKVYKLTGANPDSEKSYRENETWHAKKENLEKLSSGAREHAVFSYYLEHKMKDNYLFEFEEASKTNPYDIIPLVHLGIYYRAEKEYEKSISFFNKALSAKKNRAWVHLEMAHTFKEMENIDRMAEELRKARRWLLPYNAGLWKMLGSIYRLEGNNEKSIKYLKKLLKTNKPVEWLCFELAFAYKESGNLDEAIKYFQKELELYPKGEWKSFELALLNSQTGKPEQAIKYFQRELELYPPREWKHIELGKAFRSIDHFKSSLENIQKELELFPHREWKNFELGETYRMMNKYHEAIECYQEELELFPGKSYVHYQLASLLKNKGKLDDALTHFNKTINDNNLETNLVAGGHYHIGAILARKNKVKEAVSHFKKCIDLIPDHKKAKEQLNQLEVMV